MLPARFMELRIRDKPTNIGFVETRTPYIFVTKKKKDNVAGLGESLTAHFHEII